MKESELFELADKEIERTNKLLERLKKRFWGLIACRREGESLYSGRYHLKIPGKYLTKDEAEKALFFMLFEKKIPIPKDMIECVSVIILTEEEVKEKYHL